MKPESFYSRATSPTQSPQTTEREEIFYPPHKILLVVGARMFIGFSKIVRMWARAKGQPYDLSWEWNSLTRMSIDEPSQRIFGILWRWLCLGWCPYLLEFVTLLLRIPLSTWLLSTSMKSISLAAVSTRLLKCWQLFASRSRFHRQSLKLQNAVSHSGNWFLIVA